MITLFIDTSTDTLSVALFKNDDMLSSTNIVSSEHSKNALVEIEKLFKKNNMSPSDTNRIMIINGPGSFTGLRIGVTIAKIYAWACKIKVIPISTLKAYALSYQDYDYYISTLDARRDCFYAGIYDKDYNDVLSDKYIKKSLLIENINKLNNYIVIGDKKIDDYNLYSNKLDIKKIFDYYKNKDGISAHLLNPVYLKKTEAEEKLGEVND